jgi:hypothetical protein
MDSWDLRNARAGSGRVVGYFEIQKNGFTICLLLGAQKTCVSRFETCDSAP